MKSSERGLAAKSLDEKLRLPAAFTTVHRVAAGEIDAYAHVNNTVYVQWLESIAWAHSSKFGVPLERCLAIQRGWEIRHTRVYNLEPASLDDILLLGT